MQTIKTHAACRTCLLIAISTLKQILHNGITMLAKLDTKSSHAHTCMISCIKGNTEFICKPCSRLVNSANVQIKLSYDIIIGNMHTCSVQALK